MWGPSEGWNGQGATVNLLCHLGHKWVGTPFYSRDFPERGFLKLDLLMNSSWLKHNT